MNAIVALTLTASLAPSAAAPAPPPIAAQMSAIVARDAAFDALPARPPGGDSLRNGAITGAIIGGAAILVMAAITCQDTSCIPDALMFASLGAGVGALVGAGIDALIDHGAAVRGFAPGTREPGSRFPARLAVRVRF